MKGLLFLLIYFLSFVHGFAQSFEHPRGLIQVSDVANLREKVKSPPYNQMLEGLKIQYTKLEGNNLWKPGNKNWEYNAADLLTMSAQLYLLTGEEKWADYSRNYNDLILQDTVVFLNPMSKGLTRAAMLKSAMTAYDFCYDAWGDRYSRDFTNKIYPVIFSLSAAMGREANYSIASNWMGVRYGTVLYASLLWDDFEYLEKGGRSATLSFNAEKRLEDFALANIHPDGWNVESLGYWAYGWSFVYPALIAWEHTYHLSAEGFPFYSRMIKSFQAGLMSMTPIQNNESIGIKPDFSDDGTAMNTAWLPYAYRLTRDSTRRAFRNAIDLLNHQKKWNAKGDGAFENLLFTKANDEMSPIPKDWQYFYSPGQGVMVYRNQFKDQNDIVVAFSATSNRKGHQGGDNLTFRLIGLDNIWVVGAGRTSFVAGQSSFFPERPVPLETPFMHSLGQVDNIYCDTDKCFISATGSCKNVIDHQRQMTAHLDSVSAKIVISDASKNGRFWRINTPEFNEVKLLDDGFEITGPNGTKLRGHVLSPFDGLKTGTLRYGGKTTTHNYGIYYKGKQYMYTKYIDVLCNKDIIVELTLSKD